MSEPLEKLEQAVQEFVNHFMNEPSLLKSAVVVFETTAFNEDGEQGYAANYVMACEMSPSETIGLLDIGREKAMRDIIRAFEEDED